MFLTSEGSGITDLWTAIAVISLPLICIAIISPIETNLKIKMFKKIKPSVKIKDLGPALKDLDLS